MGVSLESVAELDSSEFPDAEPSSVPFGATGNEPIKISGMSSETRFFFIFTLRNTASQVVLVASD